jgi:hypothetical protein
LKRFDRSEEEKSQCEQRYNQHIMAREEYLSKPRKNRQKTGNEEDTVVDEIAGPRPNLTPEKIWP